MTDIMEKLKSFQGVFIKRDEEDLKNLRASGQEASEYMYIPPSRADLRFSLQPHLYKSVEPSYRLSEISLPETWNNY